MPASRRKSPQVAEGIRDLHARPKQCTAQAGGHTCTAIHARPKQHKHKHKQSPQVAAKIGSGFLIFDFCSGGPGRPRIKILHKTKMS